MSDLIPVKPAESMEDVLHNLDKIIAHFRAKQDPRGFFTCLYRIVTQHIKDAVDEGKLFEDGARMARLDVIFANRYFAALNAYFEGQLPSQAWVVSFEAGKDQGLTVMQQMSLGFIAHVGLDLGVAAARVAPKDKLPALHRDFTQIDEILFQVNTEIDPLLNELMPALPRFYRLLGKYREVLDRRAMRQFRESAWQVAEDLAPYSLVDQVVVMEKQDRKMAKFAGKFRHPRFLWWIGFWFLRGNHRCKQNLRDFDPTT